MNRRTKHCFIKIHVAINNHAGPSCLVGTTTTTKRIKKQNQIIVAKYLEKISLKKKTKTVPATKLTGTLKKMFVQRTIF